MEILIDTNTVRSNSEQLKSYMRNLADKRERLESIQKQLDYEVKYKRNIVDSMNSLQIRILKVEERMEKIQYLLLFASTNYENAEKTVVKLLKVLDENLMGGIENYSNDNSSKPKKKTKKKKKLFDKNLIKIAVGVTVIGVSIIAIPVTGGSSIAIGAAVGATVVGGSAGVVSGIISEKKGGNFIDGFANGLMVGSAVGAVAGAAVGFAVSGLVSSAGGGVASEVGGSIANKTGAEVVKSGTKVVSKNLFRDVAKEKIKSVGKKIAKGAAKAGFEKALKSKETGIDLVYDVGEGVIENAKSIAVDSVKDELKGAFKDEIIGDIVVDSGEAAGKYVGEAIKDGEEVTAEGMAKSIVDVVKEKGTDLLKDEISELVLGGDDDIG